MGFLNLKATDFVYAAALSLVIFAMVKWLWFMFTKDSQKTKGGLYERMLKSGAYAKCEELFPKDTVVFNGKEFIKGRRVKITTLNQRILDGFLVGRDDEGRLCVITDRYAIVHNIDEIFEMDYLQ